MNTEKEIEKLAFSKAPKDSKDDPAFPNHTDTDIWINGFIAGYKAALQNKGDISSTISPIADFAFRLAKVIKESRSSTALFFVQQAYPDDVDGLDQRSTDDILDTVILQSQILLKEYAAIVNERKDSVRWIKASERLPPNNAKVIIRDGGLIYFDSAASWDSKITDYEWLDESQPRQDSAGVWISVEDKLPNEKDSCDDYYNEVLTLQLGSKRPVMMKYWEVKNSPFVKYWMPLPTPPESQKED